MSSCSWPSSPEQKLVTFTAGRRDRARLEQLLAARPAG
jgi:hypothetical protein